jgi:hypothetical protein
VWKALLSGSSLRVRRVPPVQLEPDQGGEERQPRHEVLGGVEEIDDPAVAPLPLLAVFLTQKPQPGAFQVKNLANRLLGATVRRGDRRGVCLEIHPQAGGTEVLAMDLPRPVAGGEGGFEVALGVGEWSGRHGSEGGVRIDMERRLARL